MPEIQNDSAKSALARAIESGVEAALNAGQPRRVDEVALVLNDAFNLACRGLIEKVDFCLSELAAVATPVDERIADLRDAAKIADHMLAALHDQLAALAAAPLVREAAYRSALALEPPALDDLADIARRALGLPLPEDTVESDDSPDDGQLLGLAGPPED